MLIALIDYQLLYLTVLTCHCHSPNFLLEIDVVDQVGRGECDKSVVTVSLLTHFIPVSFQSFHFSYFVSNSLSGLFLSLPSNFSKSVLYLSHF